MRSQLKREQINLSENLRRLVYDQAFRREKLPVTAIVQMNIDAYLLAEPRKAAENNYLRLASARNIERLIQPNPFRFSVPDSFQQQVKLLAAEHGQVV
jgi:hypothetical protein